jgi:hypothetical protein
LWIVDILSIYSEMNYLEIYFELFKLKNYFELFELEILSRDLTHVFTLTNKNKRRTELNENKNKLLNRGEGRECSESYFFITQFYLQSIFSPLSIFYSTSLFIVFSVINTPTIYTSLLLDYPILDT